jgi:hypothetical protein
MKLLGNGDEVPELTKLDARGHLPIFPTRPAYVT